MPTGNLPGWRQTLDDDFSGRALDPSIWRTYAGHPRGDPSDTFRPGDVAIQNRELELHMNDALAGWNTGGLTEVPSMAQTYGKYEIRFKIDAQAGLTYVGLLWPVSSPGPPEIDFMESDGVPASIVSYATLHYRNATGAPRSRSERLIIDTSTWHTMGLEWTPGSIRYTLDGRTWGRVTGAAVPSVPMALCLQTQQWDTTDGHAWEHSTNVGTPRASVLHVAWITQYAYDPSTSR